MFRKFYGKQVVILFFILTLELLAKPKTLAITYIANEGFLIEINHQTVLIDALFGHQELSFCETPDSSQLAMLTGATGNFKDIDLIVATHNHRDHFHGPFVAEHLHNNPSGKFLSCRQATAELKKEKNYKTIARQIISVSDTAKSQTIVGDIHITAFPLDHSPYYIKDTKTGAQINKHRNIHNMGYIFEIDGVKIFHSGDTSPKSTRDFEQYKLQNEKIDIALLGRSFLSSPEYIRFTRTFLNPDHIILMHLHPDRQQFFLDIAEELSGTFSSIQIFTERMEKKIYKIP